jgi:predicted 2-oxoglutarate/Fe(II)-dependent dioxygenase YbiX
MNYLDFIVKLDNIISNNFCNEIMEYIDKTDLEFLTLGKPGKNFLDKDFRYVRGKHLDSIEQKSIFNKIKKQIEDLYILYRAKFPKLFINKINQIDVLKYGVGGKHGFHIDTLTDHTRTVSVILNLNNNYEGGDLVFGNQKDEEVKRFKLGAGTCVFFPSSFMYPHSISPVIKGNRYCVVSWLQ